MSNTAWSLMKEILKVDRSLRKKLPPTIKILFVVLGIDFLALWVFTKGFTTVEAMNRGGFLVVLLVFGVVIYFLRREVKKTDTLEAYKHRKNQKVKQFAVILNVHGLTNGKQLEQLQCEFSEELKRCKESKRDNMNFAAKLFTALIWAPACFILGIVASNMINGTLNNITAEEVTVFFKEAGRFLVVLAYMVFLIIVSLVACRSMIKELTDRLFSVNRCKLVLSYIYEYKYYLLKEQG